MRSIWAMVHHHKWSYDELMNMIVWEKEVYLTMTTNYLKEEADRIRLVQQTRK